MFQNSGVKNGIILGVVSTIFSLVCYMINPKWLMNSVSFIVYIFIIYFMYRSAVEERKINEGLISFGEALKVTFITYIIGTLIAAIFMYVMFNLVDPSLNDVMKEVTMETAESVAKLLGGEDQIDHMYDQMENQDIKMTFSTVFINYLFALIVPGFVLSLIISAITKKVNPSA